MKLRKLALILVATIFASALLGGCQSGNTGESKSTETTMAQSAATKGAAGAGELLEFEFYRNYTWDVGKYPFDETNKIAKWVIDNKRVKVNFTWPGGGDANDRFNIMVASNALPEVIMISRDDTWTKLISKDGKNDKIMALDDFYGKYSGYRTNVSQEVVNFTKVNNRIYGILNWPKTGDWKGFGTGLILNDEIYQGMGSPKLDTLDDLYMYLKEVKEADPSIVPLQPGTGESNFGLLWSAYGEGRTPAETYGITKRPVNGKLLHVINDPRFPEFAKYLRKLYAEGLISQEYSIELGEPIKDKLKRRKVAVFCGFDGINEGDSARSILEAAGKANPYNAYPVPAAPGVDRQTIVSGESSAVGWNVICLTNNADKKNGEVVPGRAEKIYEYLDWVFSNEGQRIMLCGPEGELWKGVDEKDFPVFLPGKTMNLSAEEMKTLPLGQFMYPGNTSYVDSLKMHLNKNLDPSQREWRVNQQLKFVNNLKEATEFTGIESIADEEVRQVYVRADDYWKSKLVELVVGTEDVDAIISKVKSELYQKYDYAKYEEYATKVWQENLKKMGK